MRKALLARGFEAPAVGLGCAGLSRNAGPVIARALDMGMTMLDTADVYGDKHGANERVVSQVVAGRRGQVLLATKCGLRVDSSSGIRLDSSARWVKRACTRSLRSLATDYIDLYYLHRWDQVTPIEETISAMADLVRTGHIRNIGLSEVSGSTLRAAHAVHPVTAVQVEYSLFTRPRPDLLSTCRELGVGIVAYRTFSRGLLANRFQRTSDLLADDERQRSPRFEEGNFKHNLELVDRLRAMAATMSCTTAQLALAWVLSRQPDLVAIPGASRPEQIEENARAVELTIPQSYLSELEELVSLVAGDQYTAMQMAMLNR